MRCGEIEIFLSGYLDGELTQQEEQRVRIHLEGCASCGKVLEQLRFAKQSASRLSFPQPTEKEWQQMGLNIMENVTRGMGWLLLCVWALVTAAYSLYHYASDPTEPLFEKILVFGFFLAIGLLFFSVLSERIRESRTDRYKGVQR